MDETARLLSNGGSDILDREMDSEEDGTQGSYECLIDTVDSRLSARGLTVLGLNRGNVFLKKKFYFP
jgi:hypothetical protein